MLESPPTYNYDDMYNGVSKRTVLELTIKHLMKETSLGRREAQNLVRREKINRSRNIHNGKTYLKINERSLNI